MSSTAIGTFNPKDVTVIISRGEVSHTVSGFQENQLLTVAQDKPRYAKYTSADDIHSRVYSGDTSATITLHLNQTSASNDILTQLHLLDVRTNTGFFSIIIKDNSGRSVVYSQEAYIAEIPSSNFGTSVEARDWVISASRCETYLGGNSVLSPEDSATLATLGANVDQRWQPGAQ
jgi:hypothetical protein